MDNNGWISVETLPEKENMGWSRNVHIQLEDFYECVGYFDHSNKKWYMDDTKNDVIEPIRLKVTGWKPIQGKLIRSKPLKLPPKQ